MPQRTISTKATRDNIAKVMEILANTPEILAKLSINLSAEVLKTPLGEGERSFIEDMAHLINTEAVSAEAIYLALMLDEPLLHKVHAERDRGKLLRPDLFDFADLLAYFKFRRMVLKRVLESLDEEQWERVIREGAKQRKESVYWRARGMALHEAEHLTDLQEKVMRMTAVT